MPQYVNNLDNLVVDDQYFMEVPVTRGPQSVPTGVIGLVGTASRGPVNQATLVASYQDFVKKFGDVDTAYSLTGPITARAIFLQGSTQVYFVRAQATGTPAAQASVNLNDNQSTPKLVMTLQAKTPGTWANSLKATIATGTKSGTFKLQLSYGSETEVWDNLVIAQPATPIQGAVLASTVLNSSSGLSNLAQATFPATPNNNNPTTGVFTLSGGTNGTAGIADTDYIGVSTPSKTGSYALDGSPINYILCAEQTSPTINSGMQTNADTISQSGGIPRKAVIAFPRATQPSGLATLVSTFDDDRVYPCYGYQVMFDPVTGVNQTVSPLGFFAGLLAQLPQHWSPGNKNIKGSLGIDPNLALGPADLITIAQARVNVVGVQIPAGGIGVRGGFTLSQTPGDAQQIYVRNMKDYINTTVSTFGGQYVDDPITDDLMRQVRVAVDQVLSPLKSPSNPANQMISDYRIQCDYGNNTAASLGQNMLICDYWVKLLNIDRFMAFRTQIGSGVVVTTAQQ